MKNLLIFLIAVFLFHNPDVKAQQASDTVNPSDINHELLQQLIKEGVDSLRHKRGGDTLIWDTILFKAAQDHASYLLKRSTLSHYQMGRGSKSSPQGRVNFYEGNHFLVGENIALTYIQTRLKHSQSSKVYEIHTYQQLADDFVLTWRRSKSHYDNLLTRKYTHTGISISFDQEQNRFIAVQVFGYKTS